MIRYNINKLDEVILDFYNVTKIQITVLDTDFNVITQHKDATRSFCHRIHQAEGGQARCMQSDTLLLEECAQKKQPVIHLCHAGLFDIATPIFHAQNNMIMGYLLLGRCRHTDNFVQVYPYIKEFPGSYEEWNTDYQELPLFTDTSIRSAAKLVSAMCAFILQENFIWLELNELANAAATFISEHIAENLSVQRLCNELHVNKNVLYHSFHNQFNCTINDYIVKKRIWKAKWFLKNSTLTINQICSEVGLANPTYFSKMFREQVGITPSIYRKQR